MRILGLIFFLTVEKKGVFLSQMDWLGAVGIPYLALLTLAVIQGRGGVPTFAEMFIELGIDACILGIGVTGALFASHEIRVKMGDSATVVAVILIFVNLIITGLCLHLRNFQQWQPPTRARIGIFLGLLILGLNFGIVWTSK